MFELGENPNDMIPFRPCPIIGDRSACRPPPEPHHARTKSTALYIRAIASCHVLTRSLAAPRARPPALSFALAIVARSIELSSSPASIHSIPAGRPAIAARHDGGRSSSFHSVGCPGAANGNPRRRPRPPRARVRAVRQRQANARGRGYWHCCYSYCAGAGVAGARRRRSLAARRRGYGGGGAPGDDGRRRRSHPAVRPVAEPQLTGSARRRPGDPQDVRLSAPEHQQIPGLSSFHENAGV